ncbi:hypothetical protein ABS71_20805 [bacterium SCN 62-11]|nr:MAG: hypothetical protein ABS71_20805 [bacterium SCN 62-11]
MLVDDCPALSEALEVLLGHFDHIEVVGMAEDGAQALEQTEQLRPDVVITDLEMPNMHGADFVRTQMSRRALPIIVYSSLDSTAPLAQLAISGGAAHYLRKPVGHEPIRRQQELLYLAILRAVAGEPHDFRL